MDFTKVSQFPFETQVFEREAYFIAEANLSSFRGIEPTRREPPPLYQNAHFSQSPSHCSLYRHLHLLLPIYALDVEEIHAGSLGEC